MYAFTGISSGQDLLVEYSAGADSSKWDEYYHSLSHAFVLDPVAAVPSQPTEEQAEPVPLEPPTKYQTSIYAYCKPVARPIATPMAQVLQELAEPASPTKRRKKELAAEALLAGHRVEVLPGNDFNHDGTEYYKEGDKGTVEEIENEDDKVYILWDRSSERTWFHLSTHNSAPKFKIVGKAEFWVGQLVQRRDKQISKDWGTGYVTSIKPLLVTVLESPGARGYEWQEVRQGDAESDGEDGCATPDDTRKKDATPTPTPHKAMSKRSRQLISQRVAKVRKDASIAYLRGSSNTMLVAR